MSIGIDFLLRANTGAFTRGLAAAQNSVGNLKKGLTGFPATSLLTVGGAAFGLVRGFKGAIDEARNLRTEMETLGNPIDTATLNAAELGDAFDIVGQQVTSIFTAIISAGVELAEMIGLLDEVGKLDPEVAAGAAKGAADQKKAEAALKKLHEQRKRFAYEEADAAGKINLMLERQVAILNEKKTLDRSDPRQRARLFELQAEEEAIGKQLRAEAKREEDAKKKGNAVATKAGPARSSSAEKPGASAALRTQLLGDALPTIEELAGQGGKHGDLAGKALQLEEQAQAAIASGGPGGLDAAMKFRTEAGQIRGSLAGNIRGGGEGTTFSGEAQQLNMGSQFESGAGQLQGAMSGVTQAAGEGEEGGGGGKAGVGGGLKGALQVTEQELKKINASLKGRFKAEA